MTQTQVTTTVTFHDLQHAYDAELDELEAAYEDVAAEATDEHGDDALDRRDPGDDLAQLQAQAEAYEQAGMAIQSRQHSIQRLADEYEGNRFKVKMLSGRELMDIEAELRARAQQRDVSAESLQSERKALVVDAATVEAPEGIPHEDGTPVPSECPNPLTLALYEQVERLNQAGDTDFRAPGFGDGDAPDTTESSATPTVSEPLSNTSVPDDVTETTGGNS
jgi:hypothetical protein